MKKTLSALVLALMLVSSSQVFAVLGPVHVELNMTKPRLSAARANSLTAFKIYIRYNVNIKIHNWVKAWFPIDEYIKSDNPEEVIKQICDGLPPINGVREHQRFIPNEAYFKKYDNLEEKSVGKVYTVLDEKGSVKFEPCSGCDSDSLPAWSSVCDPNSGSMRIVKDPSGLGCWQLGTIFPALPYDRNQRMERMKTIIRSTNLGYSSCSECEGYSIIVNNCKERSYQQNAQMEFDAWRKGYNSIDWNTSKTTGIIGPATPGRYRVAVATEPEPEPVESESFILPCSDVTDATLDEFPIRKKPTAFSVCFNTGEGGALDFGRSAIRLRLPRDFRLMSVPAKSILVNNVLVEKAKLAEVGNGEQMLEITTPIDVENFGKVTVDFLSVGNYLSLLSKDYSQLNVSTSSEPNFIPVRIIGSQTEARMTVWPPEEYVNPDIYLTMTLMKGKIYPPNTEIKIIFDNGFELPDKPKPDCFLINGVKADARIERENLTLVLTSETQLARKCLVSISSKSGIVNPPVGIYDFNVFVGNDELLCQPFDIFASKPRVYQLELSSPQAAVQTNVSFLFKPSSSNPIQTGDIIGVEFPEGSVLPEQVSDYEVLVDGTQVKSVKVERQTIKFTVPKAIVFRKPAKIELKCFITNPRKKDGYFIKVITNGFKDIISEELTLIPASLVTKLVMTRDDLDLCDGNWYGETPTISFDCLNPDADIFFWFNSFQDNSNKYIDKFRLRHGSQVLSISWQARYDGRTEDIRTKDIYLDTNKPLVSVFSGKLSKMFTNQKTKLISGDIKPRPIEYYGNNRSHVLVDSLFVRFNGVESKVFDGGLYKNSDLEKLDLKLDHKLELSEGENVVELIARSLSCNETTEKMKVILDTVPPPIEMVNTPQSYQSVTGDKVKVSLKTELGLNAFCNGRLMPEESNDRKSSVFYSRVPVVQGNNRIVLKATDFAGNTTIKEITFLVKDSNTISMTLDKPTWDVNSEKQPDFACPPTATFKDEKLKALNGTTFVPVAALVPFLGCSIEFVQNGEFATIVQHKGDAVANTIILAIGTNNALVNGKQVKLGKSDSLCPVSIKGTMMVPLRFLAQYLGASLSFDSKSKQIVLKYPR